MIWLAGVMMTWASFKLKRGGFCVCYSLVALSYIIHNILGVEWFIYFYGGGSIKINVSLWYDTGFVFIILKYCLKIKKQPTNPFMFSICFEIFFNNSGQDLISTALFTVFCCSPATCTWLRNPSGKLSFYSFCNISFPSIPLAGLWWMFLVCVCVCVCMCTCVYLSNTEAYHLFEA